MKRSMIGACALLLTVTACCHIVQNPVASVVWNGEIPPLCPVDDPHIKPADRPGLYVLQVAYDKNKDEAVAFVLFVAHGAAQVQAAVGPIKTDQEWKTLYDKIAILGSARPGGFYCDGITEEPRVVVNQKGQSYMAPVASQAGGTARCPNNPHALLSVPSDRLLASGPLPPAPPPPDTTGFLLVVDPAASLALWQHPEPRVLYASLEGPTPGGCSTLEKTDPRVRALGTYVQRAVDAVAILSGGK